MNTLELRQTIEDYLNQLSAERLSIVAQLLTYLVEPTSQIQGDSDDNNSVGEAKTAYISGETTLYSMIKQVGGEPPSVLIQTLEGHHRLCQVEARLAKELGNRLYARVGLIGLAQWNLANHSLERFQIQTIFDYQEGPLLEAFATLSSEVGVYYQDLEAVTWVTPHRQEDN
jgi:hypothetical protein